MEPIQEGSAELSQRRRVLLQRYLTGANRSDAKSITIPRRKTSDPIPLSYSQQQIWLHSKLAGTALIYNEPITIHRRGELDVRVLERAFTEIVRRHEAWRTTFEWDGDQGKQIVQPPPEHIQIPCVDLRGHPRAEQEALHLASLDVRQPFDLARGPMYRLRLVRLDDVRYRLYLTLHHIIFDGVSLYRIFLPELLSSYEAFAKNESSAFKPLPIQYPDYAVWQRDAIKEIPPEHLPYWETVCDDLPVLELQTDRSRPAFQTYSGATEFFEISAATTSALKALSQEHNASLFMTMTAAFVALLHVYSGQEDIAVGGISSGRKHEETMGLLGCFLNTLVIRCAFSKGIPFTELLASARNATLGSLSHEGPFELLVQKFTRQRDPTRAPLVQALIVVEPPSEALGQGWAFTHMDVDGGTAKFDLQLDLDDRAEGFAGRFIYNTDLFEEATIKSLRSRWLVLLDRIAAEPNQTLCDLITAVCGRVIELETPPSWSGVTTIYPRESPIQRIFQEQVQRTPEAIALVFQKRQLTYDELNRRANELARRLQEFNVGRGIAVGVCMERSPEMVIALLAILKAGGAYVPLDPSYPAERLVFMINDTGLPVILTHKHLAASELIGASSAQLISLNPEEALGETTNLQTDVSAEDLAYIIYTSGSTGRPKGVAVPHRAVVRLVKETDYASFSPNETFLQLAPISFDASTFEIWGPLLNGGKLVIMPAGRPSLEEIGSAIREDGVTTLWLTSGLFNAMIDERPNDLRSLHQLLVGGDVLSVAHVEKALHELKNTRLINGYGPTESTTFACCHTIAPDLPLAKSVPIGKPIANTTAYILNENLKPVSIGVKGELFIGGDGLACGYWHRDELTAEKFIPDPFSDEPNSRLYRTGDLACWRSDGTIEFLGRIDHQIKLRGYRIEPGEIETALRKDAEVLDCVVIAREDQPGDKRLVAYIVRKEGKEIRFEPSRMIGFLKKSLPDYLVPSVIIALPALPQTPNGKIDRDALPAPETIQSAGVLREPQTSLETKLLSIWRNVLAREDIGMTDNFFDLGGHSLLGLRLVNQLREALNEHVELAIVFAAPTPAKMAALLEKRFPEGVLHWIGKPIDMQARPSTLPPIVRVDRESRRVRRT